MKLNKNQLSYWGMIIGLIFLPLFIIANILTFLHTLWWLMVSGAWIVGIIIGILIIVNWGSFKEKKSFLYLIGGILLILFPFVGGIILFIERLSTKK